MMLQQQQEISASFGSDTSTRMITASPPGAGQSIRAAAGRWPKSLLGSNYSSASGASSVLPAVASAQAPGVLLSPSPTGGRTMQVLVDGAARLPRGAARSR